MVKKAKVVGEGSYGCVHSPSLHCKKRAVRKSGRAKYISKLMTKEYADKELSKYSLIAEADPQKKFFLGKPESCKPSEDRFNIQSAQKCDIYTKHDDFEMKDYELLLIKDGGPDIEEYVKSLTHYKNDNSRKKSLAAFWKEVDRLFQGIIAFQSNGIIHHDIKPQNILYRTKQHRMNIIDFGLTMRADELFTLCNNSEYGIAEYFFWSYPCELPYMNRNSYMIIANMSREQKLEYYNKLIYELNYKNDSKISKAFRVLFDMVSQNYSESEKNHMVDQYLEDFKNMILDEMIPENYNVFIMKSIATIDVFGVGMSLQYVMSRTIDYGYFDRETHELLHKCFYRMMHPSLEQRYRIEDAYTEYRYIMDAFIGKTKREPLLQKIHRDVLPKYHLPSSIKITRKESRKLKQDAEKIIESVGMRRTRRANYPL